MNTGQLKTLLRDQLLVDARPLNKVSGQPFTIAELEAAFEEALDAGDLAPVATVWPGPDKLPNPGRGGAGGRYPCLTG